MDTRIPPRAAVCILLIAALAPGWMLHEWLGVGILMILTLMLIYGSFGRLIVAIVGAISVFQASEGITAPKLAYVGVFGISAIWAFARIARVVRTEPMWRSFRLLPSMTVVMLAFLALTLPVSLWQGNDWTDWARDVLSYVLIVGFPLLAVDAAMDSTAKTVGPLVGVVGIVGATLFTINWLGRRGFDVFSGEQFALSSMPLCVVPFTYALARTFNPGRHRLIWAVLAVAIPVLLLATGTRTTLALGAGLLGLVGSRVKFRLPSPLVAGVGFAALGIVMLVLTPVATYLTGDQAFASTRLASIPSLISASPNSDQSYVERSASYAMTRDVWVENLFLGTGPGFLYPSPDPTAPPTLVLDTPFMVFSKFGLLGGALIMFYLISLFVMTLRTRELVGYSPELTAVRMVVPVLIALAPLASLLDDKGFALLLALAVFVASSRLPVVRKRCEQSPASALGARRDGSSWL